MVLNGGVFSSTAGVRCIGFISFTYYLASQKVTKLETISQLKTNTKWVKNKKKREKIRRGITRWKITGLHFIGRPRALPAAKYRCGNGGEGGSGPARG